MPHPPTPLMTALALVFLALLPSLLLILLAVGFLYGFIQVVTNNPNAMNGVVLVGLDVGLMFFLWTLLPNWFRSLLLQVFTRSKSNDKSKH